MDFHIPAWVLLIFWPWIFFLLGAAYSLINSEDRYGHAAVISFIVSVVLTIISAAIYILTKMTV